MNLKNNFGKFYLVFSVILKIINKTPAIIIVPPMNNSLVGFSPSKKIAANSPVRGIPIVTIGKTLYKGLFLKHSKNNHK